MHSPAAALPIAHPAGSAARGQSLGRLPPLPPRPPPSPLSPPPSPTLSRRLAPAWFFAYPASLSHNFRHCGQLAQITATGQFSSRNCPFARKNWLGTRPRRQLSLYYSGRAAAFMEYVYAALLLHKLDKDVTEDSVTSVVKASGAEVKPAQVKSLIAALADIDIDEAVKSAPVAASAAAPPAAAPAADESGGSEAKEEKKDDSQSEEQAMAGLSSLFG